jgi:hypothetical protein
MTAKTSNPPVRPGWVHQIKHDDGYRIIVAPMRAGLALRACVEEGRWRLPVWPVRVWIKVRNPAA